MRLRIALVGALSLALSGISFCAVTSSAHTLLQGRRDSFTACLAASLMP